MQGLEVGPAEEVPCDPYEERKNTLKRHESGEDLPTVLATLALHAVPGSLPRHAHIIRLPCCRLRFAGPSFEGSLLVCCRPTKPLPCSCVVQVTVST